MEEREVFETTNYWLGYFAGMLDGEGTISLHKVRRDIIRGKVYPRGFDWHPCVQIGNSNKDVLGILQDITKCGTVHKANTYLGKQNWVLSIPPNEQRELLPKIRLNIKEEHRQLILEALSLVGRWNKTIEVEQRLYEIYERFIVINVKGRHLRRLD